MGALSNFFFWGGITYVYLSSPPGRVDHEPHRDSRVQTPAFQSLWKAANTVHPAGPEMGRARAPWEQVETRFHLLNMHTRVRCDFKEWSIRMTVRIFRKITHASYTRYNARGTRNTILSMSEEKKCHLLAKMSHAGSKPQSSVWIFLPPGFTGELVFPENLPSIFPSGHCRWGRGVPMCN